MARRPKNIVNDISDAVGAWLGSPRPGEYTQVTQGKAAVKEVLKSLDTTGLGQAALKDARSGSSVPSNLYKTAAMNLGAAAVGAGAAKVVGKVTNIVAPVVKSKTGKEIGIHLSNTDDIKKVVFSADRAGVGSNYGNVELNQTYKFSPYAQTDLNPKGRLLPGYKTMDTREFAETVAAENLNMAVKSESPTKKFAYITQSKQGVSDPAFNVFSNARMVEKQKVVSKTQLPQVGDIPELVVTKKDMDKNFNDVTNVLTNALQKQKATQLANLRFAQNVTGVATGLGVQQIAKRKGRGGGAKKK